MNWHIIESSREIHPTHVALLQLQGIMPSWRFAKCGENDDGKNNAKRRLVSALVTRLSNRLYDLWMEGRQRCAQKGLCCIINRQSGLLDYNGGLMVAGELYNMFVCIDWVCSDEIPSYGIYLWLICVVRDIYWVKGSVYVLKFALQRGEGEKREGMQISKQSTQNLWPKKYLEPCTLS